MINFQKVWIPRSERELRDIIDMHLYHSRLIGEATVFGRISDTLDAAYRLGDIEYDVSDLKNKIFDIAVNSQHNRCLMMNLVNEMHFRSKKKQEEYDRICQNIRGLCIRDVYFNDPVTVVIWNDGTKTIVRAKNESYDPEKGLAMTICKKVMGNKGNYYEIFKEWLPKKA